MFIRTKISGDNVAMKYFFTNLLQEIFLHHMTRYAVVQAMKDNYNVIYAAFYAYDDGAHALGPSDSFCFTILRQLNNSINYINKKRLKNKEKYELVILSDHGQIPTIPFRKQQKKQLGDMIAGWYSTYDISETPGKHIQPRNNTQDGEIVITYCGGIGHLYIRNIYGRIKQAKIEKILPGLIDKLIGLPEIGCLLFKNGKRDILITKNKTFTLTNKITPTLKKYLKFYDDPEILLQQLRELNSFDKAGDLIFFGAFINRKQINFENQFGGHGAFGGEQMHPFLLMKKEWQIPPNPITNSRDIYYILKKIITQ
jgi:hypothetical protein